MEKLAFQTVGPQIILAQEIVVPQGQDFLLSTAELHETPVGPFLQSVLELLYGSTAGVHTSSAPWGRALCPSTQVTDEGV